MSKGRLEAFSDGVIAIIITIMVLEMKSPPGTSPAALKQMIPEGTLLARASEAMPPIEGEVRPILTCDSGA